MGGKYNYVCLTSLHYTKKQHIHNNFKVAGAVLVIPHHRYQWGRRECPYQRGVLCTFLGKEKVSFLESCPNFWRVPGEQVPQENRFHTSVLRVHVSHTREVECCWVLPKSEHYSQPCSKEFISQKHNQLTVDPALCSTQCPLILVLMVSVDTVYTLGVHLTHTCLQGTWTWAKIHSYSSPCN